MISPDYASHYGPLAVVAGAARSHGHRVVAASGPTMRSRIEADGFEWRLLRLGAGSNDGVVDHDPEIERFLSATKAGPAATIRHQARSRERDLLWSPEQVATDIAALCTEVDPEEILVDHISFGSTLGMYATGRSFVTLVPGHPSQLPLGGEQYGVPSRWPIGMQPDPGELTELSELADHVTFAFTGRWNAALEVVAPHRAPVDDAFRVHGRRVLYNSIEPRPTVARAGLPTDHRLVGPLVRDQPLPGRFADWDRDDGRPRVYVALGTFLSHRSDVLTRIADALRPINVRVAMSVGATPIEALGALPDDWIVESRLPQVALLRTADLAIHHGGNNSVQEALAAGVRQIVLPFSTDQFAAAADLEQLDLALVAPPNEMTSACLSDVIAHQLGRPKPSPRPRPTTEQLTAALFDPTAA